MTQHTLPFVKGSETSREGAKIGEPASKTQRAFVLWALDHYGPLTDGELYRKQEVVYGWKESSVRRARVYLVREGAVRDSGKARPSGAGGRMTVWERKKEN